MTINCKGNILDLSSPKVMGILNITADSFYDGGRYGNENEINAQVEKMLGEGAAIIDIGAYSSRPGAAPLGEDEEYERIVPIVRSLCHNFPDIILSIDTFRSKVAHGRLLNGAAIINDISAGNLDPKMFDTVASHHAPYILKIGRAHV